MNAELQIREEARIGFERDIATHQMEIIMDNGLHKHLRFARPDSWCFSFNITTWPGYLCISGDIDCYVFTRIEDMFDFFRTDKGRINPGYWAEKCVAGTKPPREFSQEKFEAVLKQYVDEHWDLQEMVIQEFEDDVWYWVEHQDAPKYEWEKASEPKRHGPFKTEEAALEDLKAQVWEEIENEVPMSESEHIALSSAYEFRSQLTGNEFSDFWDNNFEYFTYGYLWGCHAVAWAIAQYDAHIARKAQPEAPEAAHAN